MEIGSFIELDLRNTGEYYPDEPHTARLNTARAGIFHALRCLKCDTIYLPYYLCPTVRAFLSRKDVTIKHYNISRDFKPLLEKQEKDTAILFVNYFGVLSGKYLSEISRPFQNVIIDQSPAFFSAPLEGCYNVYSARKFFGLPDGAYVVGPNASNHISDYKKDFSSNHALFLLKSIEYGSSAVYQERMQNEKRLDEADIMQMSDFTGALLKNVDYPGIAHKRKENFEFAHSFFRDLNLFEPTRWLSKDNIPMVYPLVIEKESLMEDLKNRNIYTGRWWSHVLREVDANSFEAWLSKYMLPIPIDQRYGRDSIEQIRDFAVEILD